jgi:phosphatidylglycerophosphate synthase
MKAPQLTRRPIRARDTKWAAATARWLARIGLRPNFISLLSILFAAIAGDSLALTNGETPTDAALFFVVAALCIQLRLLCNLFDGMVAVEGGFRTKFGEIYNELPDRFADALILAGAGYSLSDWPVLKTLGWTAAILAVITAYVRALGASAGAAQYFIGPMAKQQRMAVMTAACVASAGCLFFWKPISLIPIALAVIIGGCLITIWRRCVLIARDLEGK